MATPEIGSHVYIKYGSGRQPAHVVGFTSAGKVKVRGLKHGWEWCENLRTVAPTDILADEVSP